MRNFKKSFDKSNNGIIVIVAVITAAVLGSFGAVNKTKAFSEDDFYANETTLFDPFPPIETTENEIYDPFKPDNEEQSTTKTNPSVNDDIFDFVPDETETSTVTNDNTPKLRLTYDTFELTVGETAQMYWYPENVFFGNDTEIFTAGNPEIAEISEYGVITAKSPGTTTVTVSWSGLSATATVIVSAGETTSDSSDASSDTVISTENTPDTIQTAPPVETVPDVPETILDVPPEAPLTAKLDGCLYDLSGNTVGGVTLNIGEFTAVTDANGYFSFPQVNVGEIGLYAAFDEMPSCTLNLFGNMTVFLLHGEGTLEYFTAYEEMAPRFVITEIVIEAPSSRIYVGDVINTDFQYKPRDAALSEKKYISSDENIAAVDENGVITAKTAGEAVITLILNNGQAQSTFNITVLPLENGKYSGIIAAVEMIIIALVLGSCYIVYIRYKKRINEESEPDAPSEIKFDRSLIPSSPEESGKTEE